MNDQASNEDRIIVAIAWAASGRYKDGHHIGCLLSDIERDCGLMDTPTDEACEIIKEALIACSDETIWGRDTSGSTSEYAGVVRRNGDDDIYWCDTEGIEWTTDTPEWWDEAKAKAKEAVDD